MSKLIAGTPVKIVKGSNKGKKGTVGSNRAINGHQKGKLPVVVGGENGVFWVNPGWVVSETLSPSSPHQESLVPISHSPAQGRILGFLMTFHTPISAAEIAIALELPMYETSMALKQLEQDGFIEESNEEYQLASKPQFEVGNYVTDGSRTGLISSEKSGAFTVTFADGGELQCTQKELQQNFEVCGNQSGLSDSLKASADSPMQPTSSAGLNGSNPLTTTQMPAMSSDPTSITELSSKTSATITPSQEQPTSTQSDSPAITQATPATEQDYLANNQDSGSKDSVALLRGYLNSLSLSSRKESFIAACEQSLEDSEWLDTLGKIRSCYRRLVSEQRKEEPAYLQLPTLTSGDGTTESRPAGIIKCDRISRKLGIIANSQYLSAEMMALISGFPAKWTACLLESNQRSQEELEADSSTGEQSSPNKPSFPYCESNISIPDLQPGKQWLDPNWITLKSGTQSRDVDEIYEVIPSKVQQYTEMMSEGLWDWERHPLPVAFLSSEKKIYAGDCHHRASAARSANEQIYIDLRPGELTDARLFSCRANTDHGLPLRAKDQRKRIEMFLDILGTLDETRKQELLQSIDGQSWSARVIAKYLKLTESSYRTVINIISERSIAEYISQFAVGDWVKVKDNCADGTDFPWGTTAKIDALNKRKGVFIIPLSGTKGNDGRVLPSGYVHPRCLEKTDAPPLLDVGNSSQTTKPTSISQFEREQAEVLGLRGDGEQVLPECDRNEGEKSSLVDDRPFATPGLVEVKTDDICIALVSNVDRLSQEQIDLVLDAIAPRISVINLIEPGLYQLDSLELESLIAIATKQFSEREEGDAATQTN